MSPEEAMKMIRELEYLCYGDKLREVQPGEGKTPGTPYCDLPIHEGGFKKEELWTRA